MDPIVRNDKAARLLRDTADRIERDGLEQAYLLMLTHRDDAAGDWAVDTLFSYVFGVNFRETVHGWKTVEKISILRDWKDRPEVTDQVVADTMRRAAHCYADQILTGIL